MKVFNLGVFFSLSVQSHRPSAPCFTMCQITCTWSVAEEWGSMAGCFNPLSGAYVCFWHNTSFIPVFSQQDNRIKAWALHEPAPDGKRLSAPVFFILQHSLSPDWITQKSHCGRTWPRLAPLAPQLLPYYIHNKRSNPLNKFSGFTSFLGHWSLQRNTFPWQATG